MPAKPATTPPRFSNVKLGPHGGFEYQETVRGLPRQTVKVQEGGATREVTLGGAEWDTYNHSASFSLFLIREAWHRGLDLEEEADGFGPGAGTHGDWSAVRDSSQEAVELMLAKALNFLFPRTRG